MKWLRGHAATRLRSCLRSRVATFFKISFEVEGYSAVKPLGRITMPSTSTDSEMTFDSEDAEMYYIAEDMKWDLIRPGEY